MPPTSGASVSGLQPALLRQHRQRQPQPGERRAQVVRHPGQHGGALRHEAQDALLHAVEGAGRLAHLLRALRPDRARVAPHAERLRRPRQPPDRPHLVAHEQGGDHEQQQSAAHHPDHEQPDRPDIEPLARGGDLQHPVGQLDRDVHDTCGSASQSTLNGSPVCASAAARSSSIGPSTLVEPGCSSRRCGCSTMSSWNCVAALASSQSRSALAWVRCSSSSVSVISPATAVDSRRETMSRWLP